MDIPEELKYTKDHEWVRINGEEVTIGITDFAQNELGDIVYVEVDTEGETLNAEDVFGSVEAVKTVSDLFLPVDGEILLFNEEINDAPEQINESPYEQGWIIKVKPSDPSQLDRLLSAAAYKELIA